MKLSKRAVACVSLMKEGAYWRHALESSYRGGEKFHHRLKLKGFVVSGFGSKTFFELEKAGLLKWMECPKSSTWPSEYILSEEV